MLTHQQKNKLLTGEVCFYILYNKVCTEGLGRIVRGMQH